MTYMSFIMIPVSPLPKQSYTLKYVVGEGFLCRILVLLFLRQNIVLGLVGGGCSGAAEAECVYEMRAGRCQEHR